MLECIFLVLNVANILMSKNLFPFLFGLIQISEIAVT